MAENKALWVWSRPPSLTPGLASLRGLTRLRRLTLCSTSVTDEGMEHVAAIANLEELDVHYTRVTEAGLARLTTLARLRRVLVSFGNAEWRIRGGPACVTEMQGCQLRHGRSRRLL